MLNIMLLLQVTNIIPKYPHKRVQIMQESSMGTLVKSLFWDPSNIKGKEQKKVFTVSQSFMSKRYGMVSIHLLKD